jgi:hypothetical protein
MNVPFNINDYVRGKRSVTACSMELLNDFRAKSAVIQKPTLTMKIIASRLK